MPMRPQDKKSIINIIKQYRIKLGLNDIPFLVWWKIWYNDLYPWCTFFDKSWNIDGLGCQECPRYPCRTFEMYLLETSPENNINAKRLIIKERILYFLEKLGKLRRLEDQVTVRDKLKVQ